MQYFYNFDEYSIPYRVKVLFWGFYMVVFVYAVWKTLLSTPKRKKDITCLFGVFFALYAMFYCINPDYFRYRDWIYEREFDFWEKEQFYVYTIFFCRLLPFDYPYEVFRFIVWGGAVFIAYHSFRMYRDVLLPGLVLLLLFVFFCGYFSYGRASLAMAVYFFGITLYLCYKFPWRIMGIVMAILSYFLHHEMIVAIALLPCLFIPFEKKKMVHLSIIGLIVLIIALSYLTSYMEYLDSIIGNEDISTKIEDFSEQEQGAFRLSTLIKYLNFFYPFYLITKFFWERNVHHSVTGMYRITYGILMVSVAFMIVAGARSVFCYRIMYIAMIPLALLIGYGYCERYFKMKHFLIMMLIALLSNSVRFINAQ